MLIEKLEIYNYTMDNSKLIFCKNSSDFGFSPINLNDFKVYYGESHDSFFIYGTPNSNISFKNIYYFENIFLSELFL